MVSAVRDGIFIDLSLLSTANIAAYLFDRPVPDDKDLFFWDEFEPDGLVCEISDPEHGFVVATHLFENFAPLAGAYSPRQVSQGVWSLLGPAGMDLSWQLLWNDNLPSTPRAELVKSMELPYRDYYCGHQDRTYTHACYMWWDLLEEPNSPNSIESKRNVVREAIKETLQGILQLPDPVCQAAALHGLGHLRHPDRPKVVQQFMNKMSKGLFDEGWIRMCRDGTVM